VENTRSERGRELLTATKNKITEELEHVTHQLAETDGKLAKFNDYIAKKEAEIDKTKVEIKQLADIETSSKKQIDQNIELLTWLIETIDNTVKDLKNSMINKSEEAIRESAKDFVNFVEDLEDILTPMVEASQITNQHELKTTIVGIAETLKIFSENIEDSIDQMTGLVQKANANAVDESSQEFDNFVEDIHQIFNTFNSSLQKLQLTNSIKKYLDLEEIFKEIDHFLDQIAEVRKKKAILRTEKILKEDEIKYLDTFGIRKDATTLKTQRVFLQKRFTDLHEQINQEKIHRDQLEDKFNLIQTEKTTLRDWFNALSDEIIDHQNQAAETYNIMYELLDNIHSTISFIKADIRNSSELTINVVIRDFTKTVLTFGRMVGIIRKLEQGTDMEKMQNSLEMIYQKSEEYIIHIREIINNLSNNVKRSNIESINQSFKEFDTFVKNFKEKFYIIQENVANITLRTSEQLINDLVGFFEDEIQTRQAFLESNEILLSLQTQSDEIDKLLQGIDNEIKLYGGVDDRSRRKRLLELKIVTEIPDSNWYQIRNRISNDGVTSFENLNINDIVGHGCTLHNLSKVVDHSLDLIQGKILQWKLPTLDKKETQEISYTIAEFKSPSSSQLDFTKNISLSDAYRFRRLATPITLTIVEQNGEGAYILTNTAEKDKIWDITLEFTPTANIPQLPNVSIKELKPQESFIKKYRYNKSNSLVPKIFVAEAKHTYGIVKKRSTTHEKEYNCELFFVNDSEFLMYMVQFDVYKLQSLNTPIITVLSQNLEILRPKLDFRKEFEIQTDEDPPNLVIILSCTLHLNYEYDLSNRVTIQELKSTPEKEISVQKGIISSIVPTLGHLEEIIPENTPEILTLNTEIAAIKDHIQEYQTKLSLLQEELKLKQNNRISIIERLKQTALEAKRHREEEKERQKPVKQQAEIIPQKTEKEIVLESKIKTETKKSSPIVKKSVEKTEVTASKTSKSFVSSVKTPPITPVSVKKSQTLKSKEEILEKSKQSSLISKKSSSKR
jgi:hypothetical protein